MILLYMSNINIYILEKHHDFKPQKYFFHLPLIVNAPSRNVRITVFSTVLYHKFSHLNVFSSFI